MRKVINIVNNENMKCDKCGSMKIEQKDWLCWSLGTPLSSIYSYLHKFVCVDPDEIEWNY